MSDQPNISKMVFKVIGGILAVIILFASYYTIDQGERGVVLRWGAVVGTAEPGLGIKLPFVMSIRRISIQDQARQYAEVLSYSRDQQVAALALSVSYRLPADQVVSIYSTFGGEEGVLSRLLDRQVLEEVKNVFGRYNAVAAIQERQRLNADVEAAIRDAVKGPIIIVSVQIENIDFSDAYEASIEQRMLAEVEVEKVRQNAERERVQAEIAVIQAQATADARVATAKAEAEATRLRGDAEADAIRARGDALAQNPALVALVQAEKWDGRLPTTMIPGSAVPFLNVNP